MNMDYSNLTLGDPTGNLTVVIQAGGESKRMGRSKATVPFLGEPLIMRGVRRLLPIASEMIITTNEPDALNFLPSFIKLQQDLIDVRGSITGAYTALHAANKEYVALVACDMVAPSPALLLAEKKALEENGTSVAIPHLSMGYEPFHAVYRKSTCEQSIDKIIGTDIKSMRAWLDNVDKTEFSKEMLMEIDFRGGAFMNANTPEELEIAEKWVRNREGL
jgi:molybdopterin-guanine dinucleotide biosynthesis protein